uniref:Uncharacterized protein n=1 Tax=Romanomermis culicivorax TaxID=13658 RepID=A0A915K4Q6_ROMCU
MRRLGERQLGERQLGDYDNWAVEYFAEWSLSPKNEAYLRVQTGVSSPLLVGDKVKWFKESLQPVNFMVYQQMGTLGTAWSSAESKKLENDLT